MQLEVEAKAAGEGGTAQQKKLEGHRATLAEGGRCFASL